MRDHLYVFAIYLSARDRQIDYTFSFLSCLFLTSHITLHSPIHYQAPGSKSVKSHNIMGFFVCMFSTMLFFFFACPKHCLSCKL